MVSPSMIASEGDTATQKSGSSGSMFGGFVRSTGARGKSQTDDLLSLQCGLRADDGLTEVSKAMTSLGYSVSTKKNEGKVRAEVEVGVTGTGLVKKKTLEIVVITATVSPSPAGCTIRFKRGKDKAKIAESTLSSIVEAVYRELQTLGHSVEIES
mmetsp:Transcript_7202/g.12978  ORF Transcript_7202/g.12978 Transcript_7202/m.12978 type:complete len:155 (+) Transcript_7202:3-467(+)